MELENLGRKSSVHEIINVFTGTSKMDLFTAVQDLLQIIWTWLLADADTVSC